MERQMNLNGIDVDALGAFAQGVQQRPESGTAAFKVSTVWQGQTKTAATVASYRLGEKTIERSFDIAADEPAELLGTNTAPNPQELLLAALNACMSVGYAANAAVMGIRLDKLEIESFGQLDLRGFLGLDAAVKPGYEEVSYTVRIRSNAPREKLDELHAIVMKTSPNFSNFASAIRMVPTLVVEAA
jgi:uncharacterized OsmC-like protein